MIEVYQRINWEDEPSMLTPLSASNLNKIDSALKIIDTRVVQADTTKANQTDLLLCVKSISYDEDTGVFVFTWQNGTTKTVDLNIEKIPVSFSMSPDGVITMTTTDGSTYTADVSKLIKAYSFNNSDTIAMDVQTDSDGNKTITASVVDGSITAEKLQPNYLADVTAQANTATQGASASTAQALVSEGYATGTQNGEPVDSSSIYYHNNAKYYKEQAPKSHLSGLDDVTITNVQNKQALVYDEATEKWINGEAVGGGILPRLHIVSESGSIVTVSKGSEVLHPVEQSGVWECDLSGYGTWRVDSNLNGDISTVDVYVDSVKIYNIDDSHFHASIIVSFPSGATCYISKGIEKYYATSNPQTFTVHSTGDWIVTAEKDGQSKSETVVITTEGQTVTVDIQLVGMKVWLTKAGISTDYATVADISETDMRKLMTMHASSDYLIEWYNADNSIVQTFTTNPKAMKWIGLRDYICDKLMAIDEWKSAMLNSDHWECILKDKVPIMTSNTSPYGVATQSSAYDANYYAWKAFDGNDNVDSRWQNSSNTSIKNDYVQYTFTNPICVRKVEWSMLGGASGQYKLWASKDGTNFEEIKSGSGQGALVKNIIDVDKSDYYISFRFMPPYFNNDGQIMYTLNTLQFYGRSLNVSDSVSAITHPPLSEPNMKIGNITYWTNKTEREFAQGSTIKYLYDNGLELEPITVKFSVGNSSATKEENRLVLEKKSGSASTGGFYSTLTDFSKYKRMRLCIGENLYRSAESGVGILFLANSQGAGYASNPYLNLYEGANVPNNVHLDVSSINESKYPTIGHDTGNTTATSKVSVKEWWLE